MRSVLLRILVPVAAFATFAIGEANAKSRWNLDFFLPDLSSEPPPRYYYDDLYDPVERPAYGDDYIYVPRSAARERAPRDLYEFDGDYYEPEYVPNRVQRRPLRDRMKEATINPQTRRGDTGTKGTTRKQVNTPTPAIKKKIAAPAPAAGLSCRKAATIVSGYGFSGVKEKQCSGKILVFSATRGGKTYEVSVSSGSGELTEVKRL